MADFHDRCLNEGTISEMKANIRAIFQRIDEMRNIYANLNKLTESVHTLMLGDKMLFTDGLIYESTRDDNVWSPIELPSGWKVVS